MIFNFKIKKNNFIEFFNENYNDLKICSEFLLSLSRFKDHFKKDQMPSYKESFLKTIDVNRFIRLEPTTLALFGLGLKDTLWNPGEGIKRLYETIKKCGPVFIQGFFGDALYKQKPQEMKLNTSLKDLKAYTLLYWPKDAKKQKDEIAHCILVLGVSIKDKIVFFRDPNDNDDLIEKRKIYLISFKNLAENMTEITTGFSPNVFRSKELKEEIGISNFSGVFALYGPKIKIQ